MSRRTFRPDPRRRNGRAVSDVVGTILLLALTVTLFASIFFFVNTFPRPPPQPANQFQAQLVYGGALGHSILWVRITHLAGPTLSGHTVLIYLGSSAHPTRFTGPYDIGAGLNHSYIWNLGQTWSLNITNKTLAVPDNITVSIVTPTSLLFRATLPGNNPNLPPEFANVGTIPIGPGIGQGFTVYAQILDSNLNVNSVFINVSELPGLSGSGTVQMTAPGTNGLWTYAVANGATTSAGTFYLFVNATDSSGAPNSIAIPVTIESGTVTQANVALSANPSAPVINTATSLSAYVTNPGSSGGAVTATFQAAGKTVGTASGSLGAGASGSFTTSWTPVKPGTVLLSVVANVSGGGSVSGTLNLTVWPKIELVAHNVVSGSLANNESALLAGELTAAGVPFTTAFVPCTSGLPNSGATNIGSFNITIIDFGSASSGSCTSAPTAAEQNKITAAASTSFWIVGATAFAALPCNSYQSAFYALFNIKFTAGSTCITAGAASTGASWTTTVASGFRGDGGANWAGTLAINQTLLGSNSYRPYNYFSLGVTTASSSFLKTAGGKTLGAWKTNGNIHDVAMATDPALLVDNLPTAQAWGAGDPGTAATYNIINYMAGFASSTAPGRALLDFGLSGVAVVGVNHASATTFYVSVRSNGAVGGVIAVQLLVSGSYAYFGGVPVSSTVSLTGGGTTQWVTLVWQAPAAGTYTFSLLLVPQTGDLFSPNNSLPILVTNQGTAVA
ncbi:MAG: type IV pilin [Thermoplasmata archaeon]|nr:type IV pilin [Thermoplasmata archaeon]